MSLTVHREVLRAENAVAQGSAELVIDRELFLPEFEPELTRVLTFQAEPVRIDWTVGEGQVNISGLLSAEALYLTAGFEGQSLISVARWSEAGGTAIPFETTVELPGVAPGDHAQAWAEIEQAGAAPGGGHSLHVQVVLTVRVKSVTTSQYPVVSDLSAAPPVQLSVDRQDFNAGEFVSIRNAEWAIDEELTLPVSMPDAARVIWWNVQVTGVETLLHDNAVQTNGQILCEVIYMSAFADDEGEHGILQSVRWSEGHGNGIRFSRDMEWSGLPASGFITPEVRLKGVSVEAPDSRRLRLQARIGVQMKANALKKTTVVKSCHVESGEMLDLQRQPASYTEYIGAVSQQQSFRDTLSLPAELPEMERLLTVMGKVHDVQTELSDEKVFVAGRIDLTALYLGEAEEEDQPPALAAAEWIGEEALHFEAALDFPGLTPDALVEAQVDLVDLHFEMIGSLKIHVDAKVAASVRAKTTRSYLAITNAALVLPGTATRRASLVFYVLQPGDTLWDVARLYNTTVGHLAEANDLDEKEPLVPGRKILIPKN